jgi:predicted SnoaL-like aldol condensation-catalyzing enzyme
MATNLKDIATRFLQLASTGRVRELVDAHVAADFRHHNPWFPGDGESLFAAMEQAAAERPDKRLEILRVLQDGDLVAVQSKVTQKPGDRGGAVVHIFRFEGDRIAELWDVGQDVPEDSPNQYGMF